MKRTFAGICLLAGGLVVPAARPDELGANEKEYIELAGQTDLVTVRIAQMAELHASSAKVKEFATMLERSHSADLKKLTAVSQKSGGVAPSTLDDKHKNTVKRLEKAKGKSFDHAFLKMVVNQHENALDAFKREADHGSNAGLQSYAKSTLPQLEAHLKDAKELAGFAP